MLLGPFEVLNLVELNLLVKTVDHICVILMQYHIIAPCCYIFDLDSEWSAIEKEMGDGLQSAGHHMDA